MKYKFYRIRINVTNITSHFPQGGVLTPIPGGFATVSPNASKKIKIKFEANCLPHIDEFAANCVSKHLSVY